MVDDCRTDQDLMAALGRKDISALGELTRRYQDKVLALAFRLLGRWDLAEDVGQNTLMRIYHAAEGYQPGAKFTTWLYRIVVNLCHDVRRKEKRYREGMPENLEALPVSRRDDPIETRERIQLIQKMVSDLPERQKTVIVLHRYQSLSHQEIAQVTGWSSAAVESLLVRAYANLRRTAEKMKEFEIFSKARLDGRR